MPRSAPCFCRSLVRALSLARSETMPDSELSLVSELSIQSSLLSRSRQRLIHACFREFRKCLFLLSILSFEAGIVWKAHVKMFNLVSVSLSVPHSFSLYFFLLFLSRALTMPTLALSLRVLLSLSHAHKHTLTFSQHCFSSSHFLSTWIETSLPWRWYSQL